MNYVNQLLSTIREQIQATVARSDALKPLAWLLGTVGLVLTGIVFAGAPVWMAALIATTFILCVLYHVYSYNVTAHTRGSCSLG
jgi:hypothetical protein